MQRSWPFPFRCHQGTKYCHSCGNLRWHHHLYHGGNQPDWDFHWGLTQLGPSHSHSVTQLGREMRETQAHVPLSAGPPHPFPLLGLLCFPSWHHRLPAPLTSCGVQLMGGFGKRLGVDMFLLPLSWLPSPHIPVCWLCILCSADFCRETLLPWLLFSEAPITPLPRSPPADSWVRTHIFANSLFLWPWPASSQTLVSLHPGWLVFVVKVIGSRIRRLKYQWGCI